MSTPRAAIIGGNRIPFARANTKYARASNQDMLTAALDGLVARFGLQGERLGEVAAGAVLKHSRDFNLTRETVLGARLAPTTPAYDVAQACATGAEAAVLVANKIALGQIDCGVAGGVDSISDAPIAVNEDLRQVLLAANRARSAGARVKAFGGLRPGQLKPSLPQVSEPRTGMTMGDHAAVTALEWHDQPCGPGRADRRQPSTPRRRLRPRLLRRPGHAVPRAHPRPEPAPGLDAGTARPAQAGLRPRRGRDHDRRQLDPADRRRIDGAARVARVGGPPNLPVLAHLVDAETGAVDFLHGDRKADGLLMAPVYAMPRLLARHKLSLQDFDFYEIHEAFASTVLSTLAAWEDDEFCRTRLGLDGALGPIDRSRLNVNGSSLAAGHPFAATGGRIVATLAKLLSEKGSGRGLISICAAGGQGIVAILEAA